MATFPRKKFRRLLAQARSLDKSEMRALIERILPHGEGGKRVVRLETDADRRAAPMVIVGALSCDALPGEAAVELMQEVENAPPREQAQEPRLLDDDPLKEVFRAWDDEEVTELVVQGDRLVRITRKLGDLARGGAAGEGAAIVNNSENTMATADGDAAGQGRENAKHLESL